MMIAPLVAFFYDASLVFKVLGWGSFVYSQFLLPKYVLIVSLPPNQTFVTCLSCTFLFSFISLEIINKYNKWWSFD